MANERCRERASALCAVLVWKRIQHTLDLAADVTCEREVCIGVVELGIRRHERRGGGECLLQLLGDEVFVYARS